MDTQLQEHLRSRGYFVGDVAEALGLTPEEETLVDTGLALSNLLKEAREARGLSSAQLEQQAGLKSGQVALLEGAVGISFQEALHVLYFLSVSPREIAGRLAQVELKKGETVT